MTLIAFLRHGPTDWNREGRIQGQTDVPLCPAGRDEVRAWRLPEDLAGARIASSPLSRARETAMLLAGDVHTIEPRLMEMNWGSWEGERIADLRQRLGDRFSANEARGLDFRPPGGERPRDLLARVRSWIEELDGTQDTIVAVTHKGVIRVLLAEATGWNLTGKPPVRLQDACAHLFCTTRDGTISVERLNLRLAK